MFDNPKLAAYRVKMNSLKIFETLTIPWSAFTKPHPKDNRERSISDGKITWVTKPTMTGVLVRRIE